MPIILHNKYSKESRDFVDKYGEGNTVIDWYDDREAAKEYLKAGNPHPSAFPSLVDIEVKVIVRKAKKPIDLDDAKQKKLQFESGITPQ